jgi:sec-independent protein translocase protein TatA
MRPLKQQLKLSLNLLKQHTSKINNNIKLKIMGLGAPELLVIVFAILLLFGGKKIPELMRGLGKGVKEFKDAQNGESNNTTSTATEEKPKN